MFAPTERMPTKLGFILLQKYDRRIFRYITLEVLTRVSDKDPFKAMFEVIAQKEECNLKN